MRVEVGENPDRFVTLVGARTIAWQGRDALGAVIDDEDGDSYIVGPLVYDRIDSIEAFLALAPRGQAAVPKHETMLDGEYNQIHRKLDLVAAALGVEVRREQKRAPREDEKPDGSERDEQRTALEAREEAVAAWEAAHAIRQEHAKRVLAYAEERDQKADQRDQAADRRDQAANAHTLSRNHDISGAAYEDRQAAAGDRSESKADRESSADDRTELTKDDD